MFGMVSPLEIVYAGVCILCVITSNVDVDLIKCGCILFEECTSQRLTVCGASKAIIRPSV